MRKVVLFLFALTILFGSCQTDEHHVLIGEPTQTASSDLTELLLRVSSYPVSNDNIFDDSNCFSIALPVRVRVNDATLTITNEQDVADFKQIPAGFFQGFVFPITLNTPDYQTITVFSQEEFNQAKNCENPVESLSCVDIQYPITIYEYASGNQVQRVLDFDSDERFRTYLTNLSSETYYSLKYPINLQFGNETEQVVNSDAEFKQAITASENYCATPLRLSCMPFYLQLGLISYYTFSQGSLEDQFGNMDLQVHGNVSSVPDRLNNAGQAYGFNFVDDAYLFSEQTASLNNLSGLTLSLWYKPATDLTDYEALISRGSGLSCPDRFGQWSLGLYDNRRAVFGRQHSAWTTTLSQQNVWYHLVGTYDSASNQMKIYLNGQLEQTVSGFANCSGTAPISDLGDLMIGRYFTGSIDDLAIYNRALSASEVSALRTVAICN